MSAPKVWMTTRMPIRIFNFIMQLVQSLVIILGYLLGLLAAEIAGVKLATGAKGNV
jgi:hypothetical protein